MLDAFAESFALAVAAVVTLTSGAAWLVARRLDRHPALRHQVLLAALFGCLLAPLVVRAGRAWGVSVVRVPGLGSSRPPVAPPVPIEAMPVPPPPPRVERERPAPVAVVPDPTPGPVPAPAPVARSEPAPSVREWPGVADVILLAWAIGAAGLLARLARNVVAVVRLRRGATPLDDGRIQTLRDEAARRLGMRPGSVVLLGTDRPVAPMAVALGRPAVILPRRWLGTIGDESLTEILVHELAHVGRGDPWLVLVQEIARAVYWPIVPVHGLDRELRRAREELCDNAVLAGGDPIRYGATLLQVASLLVAARPVRGAVGIVGGGPGSLERRVAGLLDPRRSRATRTGRATAAAVTLGVLGAVTLVSVVRFAAAAEVATPPTPAQPDRSIILRGHVFGPEGRPVAGARLHLSVNEWLESTDLGTTDAAGAYRFEVPESTLRRTLTTNFVFDHSNAALLVTAPGLGSGWAELHTLQGGKMGDPRPEYAHDFRLGADFPIRGRVVDAAGKPVAGAWVAVDQLYELAGRRWHKMTDAIRANDPDLMTREEADPDHWVAPLYPRAWGVIPRATTDGDGRFVLEGAGGNRAVRVWVSGPGIRSDRVSVLTRDDATGFADALRKRYPRARRPLGQFYPPRKDFPEGDQGVRLFGPGPTVEVDPARTITGVVRDAATGEPIANYRMDTHGTVTDRRGWYHIVRRESESSYLFYTSDGPTDRYLMTVRRIDDVAGLGGVVADFRIPRGVVVRGRVLEAGMDRPIVSAPREGCHDVQPGPLLAGYVDYFPLSNNTALRGSPTGLIYEGVPRGSRNYWLSAPIDGDGRFSLAVPPGPGVLLVRAGPGLPMMAQFGPWKASDGYHRRFPYAPLRARTPGDGAPGSDPASFPGFVGPIPIARYHAARVINPAADGLDLTFTIPRAPARTLRVVAPDGRPVAGVTVTILAPWPRSVRFEGPEAEILGLPTDAPQPVSVQSNDGTLAATVEVRGDDPEPRTVRLEPAVPGARPLLLEGP